MADSPPYPDSYDDTGDSAGVGPAADRRPGTPRWVKVSGVILLIVVVLVGIMMLTGGGPGGHGPGRHTGSGGGGGQTPPSSVTGSSGTAGHTPPAGGHVP